MTIQALNQFILIKADKNEQVTDSGLHIGDVQGKRDEAVAPHGVVIQVPKDCKQIAVGDKVYVVKWELHILWIEGIQYFAVKEENILVKVM
jgi:co-chaperonin GroES (HSP10)